MSSRGSGIPGFVAARVDASKPEAVTALCREHAITHVLNAVDPRFVMPIFDGAFAAGADYIDMAMSLSHPHPDRPYAADRREARRRPVRQGRGLGGGRSAGPGRDGRRARTVGRVRPLRRRPPVQRDRRARRPRRRQPRRGRLRLRAVVQHLDDDRGVPQPAGRLGGRPRLVHDPAVQRAGDVRLPGGHRSGRVRQRRARGGPPHAALAEGQAGRPSSTASATSSSTCSRSSTSSAWIGPRKVRVGARRGLAA